MLVGTLPIFRESDMISLLSGKPDGLRYPLVVSTGFRQAQSTSSTQRGGTR